MIHKDEFKKYATKHLGMSTMHLEKYMKSMAPNITGFTPQVIEERQGQKIGCIEEVAYKMGYIDKIQLNKLAEPLLKSGYGAYLRQLE